MPSDGHFNMEISAINTERLGNDSLQSSYSTKTNLIISSSRGFDNMEQQQQQQPQQNIDHSSDFKSSSQASSNNSAFTPSTHANSTNNNNNINNSSSNNNKNSTASSSQHDDKVDIKATIESLLGRVDSDPYPVVTATTSQSLIHDSCTKVSIMSPVKDKDLNKTNDIVMLRNLEITPPPYATPSPNLTKDIDHAAPDNTARKRRASERTQSEQSDESSSTTGRSKRQRKQTELFQVAQSEYIPKKSSSNSSVRKKKPETKPQIRPDEPSFHNVIFYERGDHLAIRNEENTFYLCQLTESVRKEKPTMKIRWLDTDDGGKTYFLTSHYDQVPQKSIIMPVELNNLTKDKKKKPKFELDDQIKSTIMDRLKRSLNVPAEE